MTLRERFIKETKLSFLCGECGYTKYKGCCPEENECRIVDKFLEWKDRKLDELEKAMHEIYEIYAGMEGFQSETAPEAYRQSIIYQMAKIAGKYKE